MPERIVDRLELIEIDAQHRQLSAAVLDARQGAHELITELGAVAEPGQQIVLRHVAHDGFGLLAFGDLVFELMVDAFQLLHMVRQGSFGLQSGELALHARRRDGEVDRLGDVVVGPELQRLDDILALDLGGDHDDRQRRWRMGGPNLV